MRSSNTIMSRKVNILFVNGHLNVGGVERSLVDTLKHIDYTKYNVDLLLLEGLGDYAIDIPKQVNIILKNTRAAYGPIVSTMLDNLKKRDWFSIQFRLAVLAVKFLRTAAYKWIGKLLTQNKCYDTAIAYRVGIAADIVAHSVKSNKRLCWWHHGAIKPTDNLSQLDYFDHIIAVSTGVKTMLLDHCPSIANKITVIPNMVDVEQIVAMGNDGDNPYGDYDGLKFVTVGRIVVEKHIENVVKAAEILRADGQLDFKWFVIGDGELYDDIAEMIRKADIADKVILCGRQANPYPYIKHADMMVHTSHIESQGLVIQEAMALDTPCVVTRSVGPSEFIIDGDNGVMVEPNVDSLVEGIYRLAKNKELQKKIIPNGRATLSQGYTPQVVIEKIEKLING